MIRLAGVTTADDILRVARDQLRCADVLLTRVEEPTQIILARANPQGALIPESIDYSICQHVKAMDFPLVVDDALSHPLVRLNRSVVECGLLSYIGAPVHFSRDGLPSGAVCAYEHRPRRWSDTDISMIVAAAGQLDQLFAARQLAPAFL
ncbi:GAF domain protein [Aquimixticola soesokkakensis]|uniref:GAF domain protein n=1 Tax=Aquimixticola soesokkakensis TaxID=1519096 RepID=A0A1Y5SQP2_9RHOB|nr:GAF domain-containing protein [Aquimixticola soesokkakensis]SLN45493.1 GAF domain protein [Aquimixticola soesokkakensis]